MFEKIEPYVIESEKQLRITTQTVIYLITSIFFSIIILFLLPALTNGVPILELFRIIGGIVIGLVLILLGIFLAKRCFRKKTSAALAIAGLVVSVIFLLLITLIGITVGLAIFAIYMQ